MPPKRKYAFGHSPAQKRARKNGVVRPFVKGKDRVGGFYGRYGTSALGSDKERKFFDTALSFSFDQTGEIPATGQLNLIPQGVTESTRIGRKAFIKSIQIRAKMLYTPGASAIGTDNCDLYLVLDKQANGAAAAITDVFDSATLQGAMLNLANSGRFQIIRHWPMVFASAAGVSGAYARQAKQFNFYKKCNIPVEFSSTTGAITEIRSNNLFLCAGSGTEDDLVSVGGTCRLRYTD